MNTLRDRARAESATPLPSWTELNRQWLIAAIGRLLRRIEAPGAGPAADCVGPGPGFTPALIHCADAFGLSVFERELLLLLAGLELDGRLRAVLSAGEPGGPGTVSFGQALALLAEPHWDALSPDAPLRRWRMVSPEPGAPLAAAPLRLDERILHFIAGVAASDAKLAPLCRRLDAARAPEVTDPALAARIAQALSDGRGGTAAAVVLSGGDDDPAGRRDLVLAAAADLRRAVLWIEAHELPPEAEALDRFARHLDREAALSGALAVLSVAAPGAETAAIGLAHRLRRPFLWLGTPGERLAAAPGPFRLLRFEVPRPDRRRRRELLAARWRRAAPDAAPDTAPGWGAEDAATLAELDRAAGQFWLGPSALDGIAERLAALPTGERPAAVWPAARDAARGGLDALAQRVESGVRLDDLVLPSGQTAMLRDLSRQLRHRERVFDDWGFGAKHRLGQGLVALFAGESGTGKTMAAEAIANEVGLDLYRVDLATLVSKYIGETEKNLKRLFDAAETSGAVLLFDEADALFGKRSEVRDSHDRYANIEVAYLLQRVEAYRGLAVLTTNMRGALDRAFLRRIRFIITFPFPVAEAREQIWRLQLPAQAPAGAIDFATLAQLNLSGGNIRSVALAAAFKAADRDAAIDQPLLLEAAREELARLDRPAVPLAAGRQG